LKDTAVVLTNSGGLQEETTVLRIPCVTIRDNTERPIIIEMRTNILPMTSKDSIISTYRKELTQQLESFSGPPLWDGNAAERIWQTILNNYH
jgi:UDP-N-acetylglucosamine 2-epimerase (non-hydrolysing)